jgi:hypothetical protein
MGLLQYNLPKHVLNVFIIPDDITRQYRREAPQMYCLPQLMLLSTNAGTTLCYFFFRPCFACKKFSSLLSSLVQ